MIENSLPTHLSAIKQKGHNKVVVSEMLKNIIIILLGLGAVLR